MIIVPIPLIRTKARAGARGLVFLGMLLMVLGLGAAVAMWNQPARCSGYVLQEGQACQQADGSVQTREDLNRSNHTTALWVSAISLGTGGLFLYAARAKRTEEAEAAALAGPPPEPDPWDRPNFGRRPIRQ